MDDKKVVLVIGTGTIGEPLVALFMRLKDALGIDEVYFHKNTPLLNDKTKVTSLQRLGAKLCVTSRRLGEEFSNMGLHPDCNINEALNRASVVVDCTPSGVGINNKDQFYEMYTHNTRGFIAQGSESGFGKPYAYEINDDAITPSDQFIQVVSCNTHNIAALLKTLAFDGGQSILSRANFVCIRRATDISQSTDYIAAPTLDRHDDKRFGTHHAKDVHRLFETLGQELCVFSSAMKIPSQYMHVIQFSIKLTRHMPIGEVKSRLQENRLIAITDKLDTGTAFSFARDHSPICGRILNQGIVPISTLHVEDRQIMGFAFTSQDGNSLLSSVAMTEKFLYPEQYRDRLKCLNTLMFEEI